ncbi:MAG: hypothetical protein CME64_06335 [Halobacteriovoraceae bacterium]|nr:hypothetical protein [Halobacteriovoraceae bacterium]|tara:strand:- start:81261 stop:81824 length:564 start_codon:yes stop_codon:yes gene_type:complete
MKKLIFILLCSYSLTSIAAELKIQPVYSIETTRREYPEPANQITKTYVGVSALYGEPIFSGEFEIAQSTYTDTFPSSDSEVTSLTRRAMLGIRSYPITSKYLGGFLRAGVRAKQETLDIKESGETREEVLPVYIDPYAGAGLTLALGSIAAVNASATMVYNRSADVDESERYDVQYTLSATFKIGNR